MPENVMSMQQDAMRRAREMHSRAIPTPNKQVQPPVEKAEEKHSERVESRAEEKNTQEKTPDIFESFFKDKEKMMILALLVILSQESTDNGLLFSLMFLLL